MKISLHSLDLAHPRPVLDGTAVAYSCEFSSELGGGRALFLPGKGTGAMDPGRIVEVELIPQATGDVYPLPEGMDAAARLEAVAQVPGDYLATGRVTAIVWLDDELEDALVEVAAGPAHFSVPAGQAGETGLEWGQWITFRLYQLVLGENND
jgi:hypothetical protein